MYNKISLKHYFERPITVYMYGLEVLIDNKHIQRCYKHHKKVSHTGDSESPEGCEYNKTTKYNYINSKPSQCPKNTLIF